MQQLLALIYKFVDSGDGALFLHYLSSHKNKKSC
jgi:hypothetical protein